MPGPSTLALPRVVVSSVSGGGGKTMLSLGLARALSARGRAVLPLKKGPDYIDAAWLSAAAGRPATNLDPFFLDGAGIRAQLAHAFETLVAPADRGAALALAEGNRGLFDGLDVEGSCSTAALAREIGAPVLLTLNVTKMTRTAAALLQGIAGFERGLRFAGVVLNRTGSARHASYLRRSVEAYTDFEVVGDLPRLSANLLPERHMGIASLRGDRLSDTAEQVLGELGRFVAENVDVDRVEAAASEAPLLEAGELWPAPARVRKVRPVVGYVRDACLWFYFRENLEALEREGARLKRLSLFDPEPWPAEGEDGLDAVYLGGGFPEDHLEELARSPRLAELAALCREGLPVYAECGGLMVLARSVRKDGRAWPMGGVLPADVDFGPRPVGLGYVEAATERETPFYPKGLKIRAHEFHYSRARISPDAAPVLRLSRGMGLDGGLDGLVSGLAWGSYAHVFAPATPDWARRFVSLAERRRAERVGPSAAGGIR